MEAEIVGASELEVIVSTPGGVEILDLVEVEIYVREGKDVPHARIYRLRVDKRKFDTEKSKISGEEILAKVDKKPSGWKLYEHRHKQQPALIEPTQIVDLHLHKVERFTTIAKDTTEG